LLDGLPVASSAKVLMGVRFGRRFAVATRDVFSEEELEQLRGFPEISREELISVCHTRRSR